MFQCPEHALSVAYGISSLPIEPKNATQMVIDMLRERFDATYLPKEFSGLTPHDWHAQAAFIIRFVEDTLSNAPVLLAVARTQFAHSVTLGDGAAVLSRHLGPQLQGVDRLASEYLVVRLCKGTPSLQAIVGGLNVDKFALIRWQNKWRGEVELLRQRLTDVLDGPMRDAGLVYERAA